MRLAADVDQVWRALLAHPSLRGTLAGHTGTAVLEEADDDERVARFRLQGMRDTSPATATVTAALSPAGEGTDVALAAEVFGGVERDELLAAVGEALATAGEPAVAPLTVAAPREAAPVAPLTVAAPREAAPVAPPAVAAPDEAAASGLSAPAKRALVAAGAALAVWALRGRR